MAAGRLLGPLALAACLLVGAGPVLAQGMGEPPAPSPSQPVDEPGGRTELRLVFRSLGYRDVNEPKTFNPAAAFVPDRGGWTRDWSETRVYASLSYRLLETDHFVLAPGFHLGTSLARFTARNPGIGYYESWETRPALLWGPSVRLTLRQRPGQGGFVRLGYELFRASAGEAAEDVSSASGTATPPSQRDAFFSWTSHEATAELGYDWGRVTASAGLTVTAFRLDKRLTHHIPAAGATGQALAAILALDAVPSRYGYEPKSLVSPYLSLAVRPWRRLALEAALRPSAQPDVTLAARFFF